MIGRRVEALISAAGTTPDQVAASVGCDPNCLAELCESDLVVDEQLVIDVCIHLGASIDFAATGSAYGGPRAFLRQEMPNAWMQYDPALPRRRHTAALKQV